MHPRRRYTVPLPDGRALHLGERTLVMGILNVTPDSFSDGGALRGVPAAVEAAARMLDAGADLIDVGGESTRPGATAVPEAEELRRVVPVVEALAARLQVPISIDTYKASVAEAAADAGAAIVNDISGLRYDPRLAEVVAGRKLPIIVMHMRGRSDDMYQQATYHDVVDEVRDELRESVAFAVGAGLSADAVLVDPGLGFAKDATQSFEVLARCAEFAELGRPVVMGPSRKSFLARPIRRASLEADAEWPTGAAVTAAVLAGAHIVRVHAVREMAQVVRVADEIRKYHRDR
jgi:dihydropteroate synthase